MAHALRALDVEPPSLVVLRSWIGPPLQASFPQVLGEDAARVDLAVHHYRERFDSIGWSEHTIYAGIGELVARLAERGDRLAVVTSKISDIARRIVAHLPFGDRFQAVYAPGPGVRTCEKANLVAQALRELGGSAERTSMIGDRRFDIEGARANAVRAIGVLWGFGDRTELQEAGADHVVAQPSDIVEYLAG
jgi:phosphoglycolate phosphatase